MPAPRPDRTTSQPRRPSGAGGGRGGQWSNKPIADSPPGGGMRLGGQRPGAVRERLHRHGPPRHPSAKGVDKIKLAGPKVRGRRLQVTVRRDPRTGEWANPTMFGDETVRMFSDTPWNEEGAEEAKGLHAQVFVDMLNAGDARPTESHARRALHGTVRAGVAWAGWPSSYPKSDDEHCDLVNVAAAVRAEMYFRDRLILWDNAQEEDDSHYCPVVYECYLHPMFDSRQWDGEDGRLMERLAMLKDGKGRTMLDLRHDHYFNRLSSSPDLTRERSPDKTLMLPVYLLGIPDLDETVKAESLELIEKCQTQHKWSVLINMVANREKTGEKVTHFTRALRNIVSHYPPEQHHHPTTWGILQALSRFKVSSGRVYPDPDMLRCEILQSGIDFYEQRQRKSRERV